jgi:hypothetical protein
MGTQDKDQIYFVLYHIHPHNVRIKGKFYEYRMPNITLHINTHTHTHTHTIGYIKSVLQKANESIAKRNTSQA